MQNCQAFVFLGAGIMDIHTIPKLRVFFSNLLDDANYEAKTVSEPTISTHFQEYFSNVCYVWAQKKGTHRDMLKIHCKHWIGRFLQICSRFIKPEQQWTFEKCPQLLKKAKGANFDEIHKILWGFYLSSENTISANSYEHDRGYCYYINRGHQWTPNTARAVWVWVYIST